MWRKWSKMLKGNEGVVFVEHWTQERACEVAQVCNSLCLWNRKERGSAFESSEFLQ